MGEIIEKVLYDLCEHCGRDVRAEINDDLIQREEPRDIEWTCPGCGKTNTLHIDGKRSK